MSTPAKPTAAPKVTVPALRARKGGDKVVALTAYDVVFARLADQAGVDVVLVGDSLGMVVQGQASTLPVTVDDVVYHTRAVARGAARAHLCADMPFMSYQASVEDGMRAAGRLVKDAGAESVKLEGGVEIAELIRRLTRAGIPVMGHVGLTPQSLHKFGGFKIQGRTDEQRAAILEDARAVAEAGAFALVIEGVPRALAADITRAVSAVTIGIGAGPDCDGQVMVMHDLLGLEPAWKPRFVRRYAEMGAAAGQAFAAYADDVRAGRFPSKDESWD
ncbi:MAG TPA: 3-methyl-2-oxobutanoate hydroxymethyltransferase [Polyangia bacterium]|nr:3-methyl-2-oxobutanoate hydroxymethyltransferase [Polyangia bacterium]